MAGEQGLGNAAVSQPDKPPAPADTRLAGTSPTPEEHHIGAIHRRLDVPQMLDSEQGQRRDVLPMSFRTWAPGRSRRPAGFAGAISSGCPLVGSLPRATSGAI